MLHIILTVVKIIGLIIVWILGILLALLLLILTAAFRYRFQVSYDSKAASQAKASLIVRYLLWILTIRASYEEADLRYEVRLLGYPVITNDPKICARRKQHRETKLARKKTEKKQSVPKMGKADASEKGTQTEQKKSISLEQSDSDAIPSKELGMDPIKQEKITSQISVKADITKAKEAVEDPTKDRLEYLNQEIHIQKLWKRRRKRNGQKPHSKQRFRLPKLPKLRLAEKWAKFKDWRCWIFSSSTKEALATAKRELFVLLKYLLPQSIRGNIRFGFEDPSTTGQILGAVSLLLPIIKDKIQVVPDFEAPVLQANVRGKGRIRLGYLLIWGAKLLLNKKFMNKMKELKGRLGGNEHVSK